MMAEYIPPEKSAAPSVFGFGRAIWAIGVRAVCGTGYWLAQSLTNILKSCQNKQLAIDPDELEQMVGPTTPSLSQRIKEDLEKMESMEDDEGMMEMEWADLLRKVAEDTVAERVEVDEGELTSEALDHYLFYRYEREPPVGPRTSL